MQTKTWFLRKRHLRALPMLGIGAIFLAGCATEASGGGQIPSSDRVPGHFATFGLHYEVTGNEFGFGGSGRLNGAYIDRHAADGPVRMRFDGLTLGFGSCEQIEQIFPGLCARFVELFGTDFEHCAVGRGNYVSTNPSKPGEGQVIINACDDPDGESGPSDDDGLSVTAETGPYAGYVNVGSVTHGNLQAR